MKADTFLISIRTSVYERSLVPIYVVREGGVSGVKEGASRIKDHHVREKKEGGGRSTN